MPQFTGTFAIQIRQSPCQTRNFIVIACALATIFGTPGIHKPKDLFKDVLPTLQAADITVRPNERLQRLMREVAMRTFPLDDARLPAFQNRISTAVQALNHNGAPEIGPVAVSRINDSNRSIVSVRVGAVSSVFVFNEIGDLIGTPVPLDWTYGYDVKAIPLKDGVLFRAQRNTIGGPMVETEAWFAPRSARGYAISKRFSGRWFSDPKKRDWLNLQPEYVEINTVLPLSVLSFKSDISPVVQSQVFDASAPRPKPLERRVTNASLRVIDEYIRDAKQSTNKSTIQRWVSSIFSQPVTSVQNWKVKRGADGSSAVIVYLANDRCRFLVSHATVRDFRVLKSAALE